MKSHGQITKARILLWDETLTIRENAKKQGCTYQRSQTLSSEFKLKHAYESRIKPLWKDGKEK